METAKDEFLGSSKVLLRCICSECVTTVVILWMQMDTNVWRSFQAQGSGPKKKKILASSSSTHRNRSFFTNEPLQICDMNLRTCTRKWYVSLRITNFVLKSGLFHTFQFQLLYKENNSGNCKSLSWKKKKTKQKVGQMQIHTKRNQPNYFVVHVRQ